jgi:hypothetical protein
MVAVGIVAVCRSKSDGLIMRRVIAIAAAGFSLAGCSSFSVGDYFKSTPPTVQVQLDSQPQGADAHTSIGPGCKTPCSVTLPITPETTGFSVSYELNKFLPATVQALITRNPGDFSTPTSITVDPNPVVAQLQPAGPLPKAKKRIMRPKKPKPPKDAAAPPPDADSAFPAAAAPATPPPPPPPTH